MRITRYRQVPDYKETLTIEEGDDLYAIAKYCNAMVICDSYQQPKRILLDKIFMTTATTATYGDTIFKVSGYWTVVNPKDLSLELDKYEEVEE